MTPTSVARPPASRKAGAPASPLQASAVSLCNTSCAASTVPTVKALVCSTFGIHSSAVRPKPASRTGSPAAGAVVLRGTGVMPVAALSSLTSITVWPASGTSLDAWAVMPAVEPRLTRPTTTVVALAGAPPSGFSGKQLGTVRTQAGATRAPEQARPSAVIFAVKL
nr:hypothetical protein [Kutzneria sp. 744]